MAQLRIAAAPPRPDCFAIQPLPARGGRVGALRIKCAARSFRETARHQNIMIHENKWKSFDFAAAMTIT